jgi:hypothetical protein
MTYVQSSGQGKEMATKAKLRKWQLQLPEGAGFSFSKE